jgi:hypothetical protein
MTPGFAIAHVLTLAAPLADTSAAPLHVCEPTALHAPAEPGGCAPFTVDEREELRLAQQRAPELAGLRAGHGPSDDDWKWIAIGALVVIGLILIF